MHVKLPHPHGDRTAGKEHQEPGGTPDRDDAAIREEAVDEHVAHDDHKEQRGESLDRHEHEDDEHQYHQGEQSTVEDGMQFGEQRLEGAI